MGHEKLRLCPCRRLLDRKLSPEAPRAFPIGQWFDIDAFTSHPRRAQPTVVYCQVILDGVGHSSRAHSWKNRGVPGFVKEPVEAWEVAN